MTDLGQEGINGIMLGLTLCLFVLGLTLTFGIMNILNFAHGSLYTISGLVVWYLATREDINYWLAILIAMVAGALIGMIIERLVFRPFYRDPLSGLIVAVGLLYFLDGATIYTLDKTVATGSIMNYSIPSVVSGMFRFGGIEIAKERVVVMLICVALIAALVYFLNRTKQGWAIRATAQNEYAARLQGISTNAISRNTMVIGAVLAAAGAGLLGPLLSVSSGGGISFMVKGMVAVALGGLGSVGGTVIACLILGMVESYVTTEMNSPQLAYVFLMGILMVTLIVRPWGLMGNKEAET